MPSSGRMTLFSAVQNCRDDTVPEVCLVNLFQALTFTCSLLRNKQAFCVLPRFSVGKFSKSWKGQINSQTRCANQIPFPSCHCRAISSLARIQVNLIP